MTDDQVERLAIEFVARFLLALERIAAALEKANVTTVTSTPVDSAVDHGEISPGDD